MKMPSLFSVWKTAKEIFDMTKTSKQVTKAGCWNEAIILHGYRLSVTDWYEVVTYEFQFLKGNPLANTTGIPTQQKEAFPFMVSPDTDENKSHFL